MRTLKLQRLLSLITLLILPFTLLSLAPERIPIIKGLAELDPSHGVLDRAALGVVSYFHWGESCTDTLRAQGCLDMVRNWTMPKACYSTLLVGNEPTNAEPAGFPISPTLAVSRTLAIAAMCPNTRLVTTNIHINNRGDGQYDKGWLYIFLYLYQMRTGHEYGGIAHTDGRYDIIGIHCYSPYAGICALRLGGILSLSNYHGNFWMTEFNIYGDSRGLGNGHEFADFLSVLGRQLRIERVYVFTNRGYHPSIDLVRADGTLTNQGKLYRDWNGQ